MLTVLNTTKAERNTQQDNKDNQGLFAATLSFMLTQSLGNTCRGLCYVGVRCVEQNSYGGGGGCCCGAGFVVRASDRGVWIMLEKVADSARKAVKLAEPYKPYGGQFLEFCSISLSTYQTCMNLTRKSTEFCQLFCRQNPHWPS